MRNLLRTSLFCLALLAGCVTGGPDSTEPGTNTIKLTAADQGAVIDLTLPAVRWVIDASNGDFDPAAFEVRTPSETLTLADWLARSWGLEAPAIDALAHSQVVIEPGTDSADEDEVVGEHGLELSRCRSYLICDPEPDGTFSCYRLTICDCEIRPNGTIIC